MRCSSVKVVCWNMIQQYFFTMSLCLRDASSVFIGNGITSIPEGMFSGLTNLERVFLGKNVKTIGNSAFKWCNKLNEITAEGSSTNYKSIDGVLFETKDKVMLSHYPQEKEGETYAIPSDVVAIASGAFDSATHLKQLFFCKESLENNDSCIINNTQLSVFVSVAFDNESFCGKEVAKKLSVDTCTILEDKSESKGSKAGLIIGVAVAGIAIIATAAVAMYFIDRMHRRETSTADFEMDTQKTENETEKQNLNETAENESENKEETD